jgi:hypothetical protein
VTGSIRNPAATPAARSLASAILLASVAIAFAACRYGGASPTSSTPPLATVSPSTPAATAGIGTAAGQTDTDWGRIWDTLPKGFPSMPGATDGEETATGPASANLVVPGTDAKGVATRLQGLLTEAGYATVGLSGPLENGGYVLDMSGSPTGCQLQVAATPMGSLTTVTILYGASCPHD